jgi:hypothetical protein
MFCPYLYEQEGHISSLSVQLASKGVFCTRLSFTYLTYPRLAIKK